MRRVSGVRGKVGPGSIIPTRAIIRKPRIAYLLFVVHLQLGDALGPPTRVVLNELMRQLTVVVLGLTHRLLHLSYLFLLVRQLCLQPTDFVNVLLLAHKLFQPTRVMRWRRRREVWCCCQCHGHGH